MRNIVMVVGAAVALALAPQLASAAPTAGGGAFKAAAETVGSVENVYYRRRYYGYRGYYRPYRYYGYGYRRPYRYYGYRGYYRPYRYYGYY